MAFCLLLSTSCLAKTNVQWGPTTGLQPRNQPILSAPISKLLSFELRGPSFRPPPQVHVLLTCGLIPDSGLEQAACFFLIRAGHFPCLLCRAKAKRPLATSGCRASKPLSGFDQAAEDVAPRLVPGGRRQATGTTLVMGSNPAPLV